jgi:hypothetical protein
VKKVVIKKPDPSEGFSTKIFLWAIFGLILKQKPTFAFTADPERINAVFYQFEDSLAEFMNFRTAGVVYAQSDELESEIQDLLLHHGLEYRSIYNGIYVVWITPKTCKTMGLNYFHEDYMPILQEIADKFINDLEIKEPLLPGISRKGR